jgi:cyclic dehypoxanthinyl futalosine synthase
MRPPTPRLSAAQLLELFAERDLLALGRRANAARRALHPEPVVSYVVDRNINYTNICVSQCAFCAFCRPPGHPEGYVISDEELARKLDETVALGGTQVLLQGGLHPDLGLDYYLRLLRSIKARSGLHIHGFSPPEIVHLARLAGLTFGECIAALREAGLDTIPGGGAEILSDEVRQRVSPRKCTKSEWLDVMRAAHGLDMRTTATMMFGHVEKPAHIVEHLLAVRELQDETGGFTAFIPWPFQPTNTPLGRETGARAVGGYAYLKVLAICRLALDNVPNLQASWVTQGAKIGQVALSFGANDLGSTMIEENVVRAAGVEYQLAREDLVSLIRDAGFEPRRRNCYYECVTT